jgi:hypothetical protein
VASTDVQKDLRFPPAAFQHSSEIFDRFSVRRLQDAHVRQSEIDLRPQLFLPLFVTAGFQAYPRVRIGLLGRRIFSTAAEAVAIGQQGRKPSGVIHIVTVHPIHLIYP